MDVVDPIRIVVAFGVVLALIGMCALGLRYLAQKKPGWLSAGSVGRLQVIESRMLDARRKLVLVKRDGQEHLLLLSPQGDIVVETIKEPHA